MQEEERNASVFQYEGTSERWRRSGVNLRSQFQRTSEGVNGEWWGVIEGMFLDIEEDWKRGRSRGV